MKFETFNTCGENIEIPIPENYYDCFILIKSDMYRITGQRISIIKIIAKLFYKPASCTSYLAWYRLSQPIGFRIVRKFTRMMHAWSGKRCKIDMPWSVKVGWGLYIGHGMCMVINGNTKIGNNVNLSQFLNIGTNHQTPAVIGNNVYIAPSVCLVENVQIGSNSTIGAGAVITHNVPINATVAGVPAKVINYNNPGRYSQNNRWINS